METQAYIFVSVAVVSAISLVGILALMLRKDLLNRFMVVLVSFAAGSLLGAAFLDLIPEAAELVDLDVLMPAVLAGIVTFFIIERILHWHHFHAQEMDVHPFTYLNLIGDGLHNFMDGIAIAVSYMVSVPTGIATTIAVIAHEIPQEISDFSILVYGGLGRKKALLFNFGSALTAFFGAAIVLVFQSVENSALLGQLAGFAAGGLIYIATADLVPEIHKEHRLKKVLAQMIAFCLGIALIWFVAGAFGG